MKSNSLFTNILIAVGVLVLLVALTFFLPAWRGKKISGPTQNKTLTDKQKVQIKEKLATATPPPLTAAQKAKISAKLRQ